ncbi:MAG: RibD family protein, partial [Planctomycetaceae bacterium]|nr:RibD family protein [Planctomycetaceae bacterium]
DPQLTARPPGARIPTRIAMTTMADLPDHLTLIQTAREIPTLIVCGPDAPTKNQDLLEAAGCQVFVTDSADRCQMIESLLCYLGKQQMTNLLVEGGSQLLGSCFDAKAIDEVHVFVANKILGGTGAASPIGGNGEDSMASAQFLEQLQSRPVENDVYFWGRLAGNSDRPDQQV